MNRISISKDWLEGLIKACMEVEKEGELDWQVAYLVGYIQSAKGFLEEDKPEIVESDGIEWYNYVNSDGKLVLTIDERLEDTSKYIRDKYISKYGKLTLLNKELK